MCAAPRSAAPGLKYRGFVEDRFRNETNALGFLMTAGMLATF
jgi:hypothetical protein